MLTEELMREVRRLEIRARRRVDDLLAGEYHAAFKGQGIEFAEVREYEPGDDIRAIDWNVTARTGKPFVKRFIEERQLTIVLAVDTSASTAFGTTDRSKARLGTEAAAVLALAAARNNDRVGLMLFGGEEPLWLPPAKGRFHTLRVLRELLSAEATGRADDLTGTLRTLDHVLHRHAIVFVVSDFMGVDTGNKGDPGWLLPARRMSKRHDMIALILGDPRESGLPPMGLVEFADPETGRRVLVSTSRRVRTKLADRAADDSKRLDRWLGSCGVDRVQLSTSRPFGDDLARYFRLRERRR